MNDKKCFIIGLPEAGKTTFLAALWYGLNNKIDSKLQIKKYTGDLSYLSDISNRWANIEKISRTKPEFEKQAISLTLEDSLNNNMVFSFPDLSGESFQNQYEKREAKKEHVEFVKECSGIFLFIHPDKIKEPCLISDVSASLREKSSDEGNVEYDPRNPKEDDPTQVQLVELLQFVTYMRSDEKVNLCIIISAWDLIEEIHAKNKPEIFIKNKMPLLWQFITSNVELFRVEYYGVSAQGGKLEEYDLLLEKNDPCDRILVVDNGGNRYNDITLPLSMMVSDTNV